jgi:hypothetical protein
MVCFWRKCTAFPDRHLPDAAVFCESQ